MIAPDRRLAWRLRLRKQRSAAISLAARRHARTRKRPFGPTQKFTKNIIKHQRYHPVSFHPASFVSFRVRRRRLSCLTARHARRAGRSRRRASSSLELARCRELHGRRTPTDASVSFRARAPAHLSVHILLNCRLWIRRKIHE